MTTFAGIEEKYTNRETAAIWLQAIPWDGTSTWGKGADKGPDALLEAAKNMELYDIETGLEVFRKGIHILPEIKGFTTPEKMYNAVYKHTSELLKEKHFLTFLGGEHSISIGIMQAYYEKYPGLTILQLDAHSDLRKSYNNSPYNHACAMHAASQKANLIQVGVRSMDSSELEYLEPDRCFFAADIALHDQWMIDSLDLMSEKVYVSIDLDVFDPSVMPATGTPEPGGMSWYQVLNYLKMVFRYKNIAGFDIVELAPDKHHKAADMLAAQLYYKLLSYKFAYDEE